MRTGITIATLLVLFLGTSSVSAQRNVLASVSRVCTINPGYSIADVVAIAKSFEWSEEIAPGLVVIRNKVATTGTGQYDFIIDSYYPNYADMVEKRGAFLQRQASRDGRLGLDGVATCNDNLLIRDARPAAEVPGGPDSVQTLTAAVSTVCELNGATLADAVAMASGFAEILGAGAVVLTPGFGGQRVPVYSTVGMRIVLPSFADFGAGIDRINQADIFDDPSQENPISCAVPSLWASHRIHSRDN